MGIPVPPCPESLKPIQHYLTIAAEHDGRDPVVAYWCRLYALQNGLKIDKSSPEAKKLLYFLMDWLESEKAAQKDNDSIAHDIPAQAYLENYALKLFTRADEQDRAGIYNKNVVKAFYTAGMLYAMLEMFGELTEEVAKNQKYAKWKAAYIHNCLKSGEVPVPGPAGGEQDDSAQPGMGFTLPGGSNPPQNPAPGPSPVIPNPSSSQPPYPTPGPTQFPGISSPTLPQTPTDKTSLPLNIPVSTQESSSGATAENGTPLTPELITKAQKLCKYAGSALNYEDVNTARNNLRKALAILTTGKEE